MNNLSTEKVLVLSTANLPPELAAKMEADEDFGVAYHVCDGFYLVWVCSDSKEYPEAMQHPAKMAYLNDCTWIRYDQDADLTPGFQTWEW